jgi:nicotinamide-nucleotide amidase
MRIELINTGSELLYGQVLNTHLPFLAESLFSIGLTIARQGTVPDGPPIRDALLEAFPRADALLITGGLGPTTDDITRDLVAELLNLPLETDPSLVAAITDRLERRGIPVTPRVLRQAERPRGAEILHNAFGTAPGLYLPSKNTAPIASPHLFLLPGPPRELRPMVETSVLPILQKLAPPGSQQTLKIWRVVGVPESIVEAQVGEVLLALGVELGYCARLGEVDVRVLGTTAQAAHAEEILRSAFGKSVLPSESASLEQFIVQELTARRQTVATAESCTGGFVANLLTNVPGSSAVFDAGHVTYANSAKVRLGVPSHLIETHGAVSEPVASALAQAARQAAGASFGLATTGIAGPGGGSEEKPLGTVFVAVAGPDQSVCVEKHRFQTDRLAFKQLAAQAVLLLLRRVLIGVPNP